MKLLSQSKLWHAVYRYICKILFILVNQYCSKGLNFCLLCNNSLFFTRILGWKSFFVSVNNLFSLVRPMFFISTRKPRDHGCRHQVMPSASASSMTHLEVYIESSVLKDQKQLLIVPSPQTWHLRKHLKNSGNGQMYEPILCTVWDSHLKLSFRR